MSKTPRFDAAIEKILSGLEPHGRTCKECSALFQIEAGDIELLKKLKAPPPTLCPRCRLQRRLTFRANLRPRFHKKRCGAPGHSEAIISGYTDENPIVVYDDAYYKSDAWDPTEFGISYDPKRSFFEQFEPFSCKVPHQATNRPMASTGCDYSIGGRSSKDCYYVGVVYFSENLQYGSGGPSSKDSVDFCDIDNSEWCYSSARLVRCYNCSFCYDSSDCVDSAFLYDCKNCQNCFGSTSLRNKKYIFFNEQLTKEEYEKRVAEIDLGSWKKVQEIRKRFDPLLHTAVRKNLDILKAENCEGNQLRECRNCFDAFRILGGGENLRHVAYCDHNTDSMDVWGFNTSSLIYESVGINACSNLTAVSHANNLREVEYSIECFDSEFCFGCVSLRNKRFCIFNTQYTEEEYWPRVDELKTAMLERGEYGEFFPMRLAPSAYNDANCQVEFPLTKEQVLSRGLRWADDEQTTVDMGRSDVIRAESLPDSIKDVTDDVLKQTIICEKTGRPFRLTPYELMFYIKRNVPLPRVHPDVRINELLDWRLPYRLFDDHCKKCGVAMKSGYDPAKNYNVYCESCYSQAVL